MKDARTRARRAAKEDAKARANLNTIPADLIGTGGKKIEKERERGEGKVGTAFARVSESAKCKQKRREKERNKDQSGSNRPPTVSTSLDKREANRERGNEI